MKKMYSPTHRGLIKVKPEALEFREADCFGNWIDCLGTQIVCF